MIQKSILSGWTKKINKKMFLWERWGTKTRLKMSKKAANVQRKTLESLMNYCSRPLEKKSIGKSGSLDAKYKLNRGDSKLLHGTVDHKGTFHPSNQSWILFFQHAVIFIILDRSGMSPQVSFHQTAPTILLNIQRTMTGGSCLERR